MNDDPLDVMSFLKEKNKEMNKEPVVLDEASLDEEEERNLEELANGLGNVGRVKSGGSPMPSEKFFTPEDLPVDDSQVPAKGMLRGKGPVRVRVPVEPGEEVMFQMGPDGRLIDGKGNVAPSFSSKQRCHLTVIDTIIHQMPDENALPVDSRYTRWLTTDETHCSKPQKVTEQWEPIDTGWIKQCGMLMIKNREGGRKLVNPSIEEQEKDRAKVVEVGITYDANYREDHGVALFAKILPGESLRIHPVDIEDLRIRCQSGQCKVSIDAFPE